MRSITLQLGNEKVRQILIYGLGTLAFATATSFGAMIRVYLPFTPVPITGQTYFVLLSGLCLGSVFGPLSQAIYITFGILGLPYFAGSAKGLTVLLGPTGGYLLGFIIASGLCGYAQRHLRSDAYIIISLILASLTIYALGAINLALYLNVGLLSAVGMGVLPFIPGDIIKIAVAFGCWKTLRSLVRSR